MNHSFSSYVLRSLVLADLVLAVAVAGFLITRYTPHRSKPDVRPAWEVHAAGTLKQQASATSTTMPYQVTPTPDVEPTPTPRPPGTPPRVGLQIGHLHPEDQPDELAKLRNSQGAHAAGYHEVELNEAIARRIAMLLQQQGLTVDLLPATVPPAYDADVFVAIHADGISDPSARGFKLATPWRASRASRQVLEALTAEYAAATGLPWDDNITVNMRGYYAFSYRRYKHAIAKTTPAVIIEMGYLSNPADRALLVGKPNLVAQGIANGILRYLSERDPKDGAALLPPEYSIQQPTKAEGVDIYAAPSKEAPVLFHATASHKLFPFREQDGWYEVVVRNQWHIIGWVRANEVETANQASPTPADDS